MFRVTAASEPREGAVDLALDDPSNWWDPPYPMGKVRLAAALFGDEDHGPFAALYSDPPRSREMPVTPGHGHGSDSWRISLKGSLRMGAQHYGPGQFRFQKGGRVYGSDNASWGDDGGCSVIIMGDRRGAPPFAAKPEDKPRIESGNSELFNKWIGTDKIDGLFGPQGLATTLGPVRAGHTGGSFEADWPELVPGVTFAAGLIGDRISGPVVVMTKVAEGGTAYPALRLQSETMHVIVRGSGEQDGVNLPQFHVRVVESGTDAGAIVAGPDGLWLTSIIGDRRTLPEARTDTAGADWHAGLMSTVTQLEANLV